MPHRPIPVNGTGKLLTDLTSDNGAPSAITDGFQLSGDTHLLLAFGSSVAFGSYHAKVFFMDPASNDWALDTQYGTAGNITISRATKLQFAMNRFYSRVYVEVFTFSGGMKASVCALQSDVTS